MAKQLLFNRGSIKEGDNKVVCESRFQPHYIKPGCYLKFDKASDHYLISKDEDIMLIFDFEFYGRGAIFVEGDEAFNLVIGDEIDVTFKQYKLNSNIIINNGGNGYAVGDIIQVSEGLPVEDPLTNEKQIGKIKVTNTSEAGEVLGFEVVNFGLYLEAPNEKMLFHWSPSGGSGTNLELNVIFDTISHRGVFQREVADLQKQDEGYVVYLDMELPSHVRSGKLSVKKKILSLSTNYVSSTSLSETFQLIVDFSENYGLPMLVENSLSLAFVYNKGINMVDAHIKALERRIEELEKKLTK